MAGHPLICSRVFVQSQALAEVRAWVVLKAVCGFFDDGTTSLPVEPCAPICPALTGAEVSHA